MHGTYTETEKEQISGPLSLCTSLFLSPAVFCGTQSLLCIQCRRQHLDHLTNGGTYTHNHTVFQSQVKDAVLLQ